MYAKIFHHGPRVPAFKFPHFVLSPGSKVDFPSYEQDLNAFSDPSDTWHLIRSLVITPRLGRITADNMAPVAERWRGVNQLCQHHSVADKPQMKTSRIPQACDGERMWSQGFQVSSDDYWNQRNKPWFLNDGGVSRVPLKPSFIGGEIKQHNISSLSHIDFHSRPASSSQSKI